MEDKCHRQTDLTDWLTEQGFRLTSNLTHFRSFWRRWGDCGISQDCSRIQSPQCVRCWVVCVRSLLITVVCMRIIWKALCPYVLHARLGLWVSLEHCSRSSSSDASTMNRHGVNSLSKRTYKIPVKTLTLRVGSKPINKASSPNTCSRTNASTLHLIQF